MTENLETFVFNICEHPDSRIVKTIEVEAKDEDEAQKLAHKEFVDFVENLYFEKEE